MIYTDAVSVVVGCGTKSGTGRAGCSPSAGAAGGGGVCSSCENLKNLERVVIKCMTISLAIELQKLKLRLLELGMDRCRPVLLDRRKPFLKALGGLTL